jgi:hypothetical protein
MLMTGRNEKGMLERRANILVVIYVWVRTAWMDHPFTSNAHNQDFDARPLPFACHAIGCSACWRHRGNGAGIIKTLELLRMMISIEFITADASNIREKKYVSGLFSFLIVVNLQTRAASNIDLVLKKMPPLNSSNSTCPLLALSW